MKSFNNFDTAFNWVEKTITKTNEQMIEETAREVYKDSEEYTYIDTQTMYDSGENSDFKGGFVVIRAPQVRWLYYTTGIKGRKNKAAVPQWFEKTKIENIKKYARNYATLLNKNK